MIVCFQVNGKSAGMAEIAVIPSLQLLLVRGLQARQQGDPVVQHEVREQRRERSSLRGAFPAGLKQPVVEYTGCHRSACGM